ncbi:MULTISPECIES: Asp-tRNA(Asn)/Glu-tRNA(Gln) amidotransferase subunit GatA [Clostridium]|uniref:Asp-tRNA(Asn)/Glu-tRNA(Gln) amidotransferase subunit GatA n=1 Tax=Clostridium TaxID=1485 RepID=UPI00069F3480|nr:MULTISPECIES: Asp-tRNA(Asn)/Glu-tRNA(Gln) amidotransferase subunit GatA [Clostridium]KOF57180.1 glutamyl-tRNA amidotransferase [Clostridium sp. DMHC 10]MCD2348086.1 Asp-tRNA(Asn)/Glu-tRNA(Gln) amidotransferase subunit GatA [Clostridium guangxiense]
MDILDMTVEELKASILNKELKSQDIVKAYFDNIEKTEPEIEAYITLCKDYAVKQAKIVDEKIAKGEKVGKLAGIPIAIKDNICTDGIKTTCASKMLYDFVPPYDATVIKKLKEEDAVIIGKANMDEFAMGSSTENSAFKVTKNPRDITRVPGGSSGGSAAVVAAKMAPISLGSDTGGSIRQPAAFCGVVGLKPTYGLVSRFGLIAFGSSLDQIGPFGKTVKDCAELLDVIAGEDQLDNTSVKGLAKVDYLDGIDDGIKGMKIGMPKEFFGEGLDPEIKAAVESTIEKLKSLGAEVTEMSLPITEEGLSAYYIISSAEASSNLARFDGIRYGYRPKDFEDVYDLMESSRTEAFGDEVKRRIMLGTYALSSGYYDAYYKRALKLKKKIKLQFKEAFEKFDLILSPVSPVLPFKIGEKKADPLEMYLADIYTVNINLAGIPAISMPCAVSKEGLPIGLQLLGPHFGEKKIFRAARALEKEER